MLILPADHLIQELEKFLQVVYRGIDYAKNNKIVTFGIKPIKAETGFGYIESKNEINDQILNGNQY